MHCASVSRVAWQKIMGDRTGLQIIAEINTDVPSLSNSPFYGNPFFQHISIIPQSLELVKHIEYDINAKHHACDLSCIAREAESYFVQLL